VRITRKLGLLVAVPVAAVLAFAALAVVTTGGEALRAGQLRQLVAAGGDAGELAHQLQRERAAAVLALTSGTPDAASQFTERVATTQAAADQYRQARAALTEMPVRTATLVERIDSQLARLGGVRDQVADQLGAASAVAFAYRILIADLIGLRESVAQGAPADVADRLRAAAALSDAAEQVGRQQVAVLRAIEFGSFTPAAAQEVMAARGGHVEALLAFDGLATPTWRAALDRTAVGAEALAAKRLEDQVARTPAGGRLRLDRAEWSEALDGRMQRLREAEVRVDADILAEVTALRDARRQLTGGQISAVALAVAVALALAVVLGRPVVTGLRRLRDAAHEVAYGRLPGVVHQLEASAALGGLSPEQVADQAQPPVQVRGRDELAEVGAAFNTVHREAIRTAAEQARLRLSIAAIMRNLARRGQKLTDRLTTALDDVERDELNPKRLSQLYRLDLMATLLAGTNESLLVLGDAGAAQVRTADEQLGGVVQAALGRVEQYERVEVGVVDDGVAVRASVIDDVVKLLAELLDNACRYSSPASPVRVDARWLSDRVIVQVADEGIGIEPVRREQLNRRLASRPPLDLAAVETMGLTVVAYLAARHGIRVELKAAYQRGTIAEVTLPPELVAIAALRRGLTAPRTALTAPTAAVLSASMPSGAERTALPALPAADTSTAPLFREQPRALIYEQVQRSRWFTPAKDPADHNWGTAADAGWQAAAKAATPRPAGVTPHGLPVRRPGAQLVPGGVSGAAPGGAAGGMPGGVPGGGPAGADRFGADGAAAVAANDWRDPARASAVAAAYSRGLASGRAALRPLAERNGEPAR
jgi:HAMP domain-containing protein